LRPTTLAQVNKVMATITKPAAIAQNLAKASQTDNNFMKPLLHGLWT
jgi:hypothetical protein